MTKKLFSIFATLILVAIFVTGCAKKASTEKAVVEDTVIKVASHAEPMTNIVELAAEEVKKDGYTIELVRVSDNVQPNQILNAKEIDANFFQHGPYMEAFNSKNNGNLVVIQPMYDAIVGFYSKNHKSIEEVPNNAKIAIPNDPGNEGRALAILDSYGLIKLKDGVKYNATVKDIVENSHNFEFLRIDLLNLTRSYDEVDLVFNYPAYMKAINLTPKKDALILEKSDNHFAVSLVAREDNKDSKKIEVLKKAMTSDAIKDFIVKNLGEVTNPSF